MNGKDECVADNNGAGAPQIDGTELPPVLQCPGTDVHIFARVLALEEGVDQYRH